MRAMFGWVLFAAACGGGTGPDPDLTDAMTSSDAGLSDGGGRGLAVTWSANPALPGDLQDGVTVASATFNVELLEVIGDGGSPEATTARDFVVAWAGAEPQPAAVHFENAPSALYSQVALRLDGNNSAPSYVIKGSARLANSQVRPFEIRDTAPVTFDIRGYDIALSPGTTATVPVRIDLRKIMERINFDSLPIQNGVLILDQNDPQISEVRELLEDETFKTN